MATVRLFEDDAGTLCLLAPDETVYMDPPDAGGFFAADANALLWDDIGNWTLVSHRPGDGEYPSLGDCELVAEYYWGAGGQDEAATYHIGRMGNAAHRYTGQ